MTDQKQEWAWTDARELGVQGRPFEDAGRFYSRLPARAEGLVEPAVWNLALQSTGLRVEFVTDSTRIAARVAYLEGSSGGNDLRSSSLDLYVERDGRCGWVGAGPKPQGAEWEAELRRGLPAVRSRYTLYLPHGAAIEHLAVGVEPGAAIEPAPASAHKPLCFYGTSIVHGFNASRPGMTYPAILGRRLGRPFLNMGFSGNARMQPPVVELLAELDPSVYVVACLENMWPDAIEPGTLNLAHVLRAAHPDTPIVLMENIVYQATYMLEDTRGGWGPKNERLRAAYEQLVAEGVTGLHYIEGDRLLGEDGEAAVDGTHPTDLGFFRMANALEPILRKLV